MKWTGLDWNGEMEWNVASTRCMRTCYALSFFSSCLVGEAEEWPFYLLALYKYSNVFGDRMSGTIDSPILLCDLPPVQSPVKLLPGDQFRYGYAT